MILIKDLTISYDGKSNIIDSLYLSLEKGNIHGIVGLNGAGKTTLLNAIYGLIKRISGEISCDGCHMSKKDVSYLVTENFFYSNITAREYLNLFSNQQFDLNRWNELFLLPLDAIIDNYSTGMKKKLALLAVLKQDKAIMWT